MKKLCAMLLSTSIFNSSLAAAGQDPPAISPREDAGFGLGAILGGLIGGPPGAVMGAADGSLFGNHDARKDDAIATLEKQLQEKNLALAAEGCGDVDVNEYVFDRRVVVQFTLATET